MHEKDMYIFLLLKHTQLVIVITKIVGKWLGGNSLKEQVVLHLHSVIKYIVPGIISLNSHWLLHPFCWVRFNKSSGLRLNFTVLWTVKLHYKPIKAGVLSLLDTLKTLPWGIIKKAEKILFSSLQFIPTGGKIWISASLQTIKKKHFLIWPK